MLRTLIKPFYLSVRQVALRALVRPGHAPVMPAVVRSLLVITDRRLGDVSMTIPILQCFRNACPDANFVIVTPESLQPLVQWACSPNQLVDPGHSGAILKTSWDAVIDLSTDYHLRPARLAASTGAPVRIGFEYMGRGSYFNVPLQPLETESMQDTYARALVPFGLEFRRISLPASIPVSPVAEPDRRTIALHPGAHHPTQRWPEEYFVELIRKLQAGDDPCLVLGGAADRELVERIAGAVKPGCAAAVVGDPLQLAATLRSCEVLIANNSGPLHLAGLLGVPTLSFMGPTLKNRWWPVGSNSVVLRDDSLPCIGCNSGHCMIRTHACMRDISPDRAFEAYSRLRAMSTLGSST